MNYLEQFKAIRKEMGLTQAELAELLGIARRSVQDIEGDVTPCRKVHLLAIRHLAILGDIPS